MGDDDETPTHAGINQTNYDRKIEYKQKITISCPKASERRRSKAPIGNRSIPIPDS